jgi:hypothetical protein
MSSASGVVENAVFATVSAPARVLQLSPFFRAFVCSFVTNVPSAHLFLFTHPPATTELLSAHLNSHPRIRVLSLTADASSLQYARYSSYLELLRSARTHGAPIPNRVALVDATDVVFQADVFQSVFARAAVEKSIYFSEESRDYNLGQQYSNALWVRELYGEAALQQIRGQPVLCSGFTIGDVRQRAATHATTSRMRKLWGPEDARPRW